LTESIERAGANTLAEILSEPDTWSRCFTALDESGEIRHVERLLPSGRTIVFIGCGSSYYLALAAAATWSLLTGEDARANPASELLLFPKLLPGDFSTVLISRSGRTSEIIETGRYLKGQNQKAALAITCAAGTPIEDAAAEIIHLPDADEKSMVMTRSFTSMLLALQSLAAQRSHAAEFVAGIRSLPREVQPRMPQIDATIRRLVESRLFEDYVFLGQGPFFGIAQESMLKLKEMSCSYGQCFHTLEFRHGPKAIVSPETLVTFFLSERGFDAEASVLQEIKGLGATTLVVTNRANQAVRDSADYLVELALRAPELARGAAFVIPGQLLGFHTGIRKGFDPDNPRHLSRVVLLEGRDGDFGRDAI
jgi:glutamine---fructose-6-phosphate transaminase (isomerizing)